MSESGDSGHGARQLNTLGVSRGRFFGGLLLAESDAEICSDASHERFGGGALATLPVHELLEVALEAVAVQTTNALFQMDSG